MERQHQPQEEQFAVTRLVGLRGIAERRLDDRQRRFLQPARGKHEVIAQAVVQRQRRAQKADRDDKCEQRHEDGRDRDRKASGLAGGRRVDPEHARRRDAGGEQTEKRHGCDEMQTPQRDAGEDDGRKGQDRRPDGEIAGRARWERLRTILHAGSVTIATKVQESGTRTGNESQVASPRPGAWRPAPRTPKPQPRTSPQMLGPTAEICISKTSSLFKSWQVNRAKLDRLPS